MTATAIRFEAQLLQPADVPSNTSWTFLVLPASASTSLPTRGIVTVEGSINGHAFKANLEPDGQRSHWLKVPRTLRVAAKAEVGAMVNVELAPAATPLETPVPPDLRKALAATPKAAAVWKTLTPVARRDWIQWITSAKKAETRASRIEGACDMLGSGKRRVCCFDRSGFYSKGLGAPKARA
jgi:hypothetical protein